MCVCGGGGQRPCWQTTPSHVQHTQSKKHNTTQQKQNIYAPAPHQRPVLQPLAGDDAGDAVLQAVDGALVHNHREQHDDEADDVVERRLAVGLLGQHLLDFCFCLLLIFWGCVNVSWRGSGGNVSQSLEQHVLLHPPSNNTNTKQPTNTNQPGTSTG